MYNVTLPKPEHSSAYNCSKNDHYVMMEHVLQSENYYKSMTISGGCLY